MISSGLIDLQINGAYGWDFTSDPSSIWQVGARLPEQGVTGFLPTIITSTPGTISEALKAIRSRPLGYIGAEPLGLHLEGPFLSAHRAGTHDPGLMQVPALDLIEGWSSDVAMVTLAPEIPGAEAVVKHLTAQGVIVSAGHSAATYDEAMAGFDWGIAAVTHLFNAMEPFSHREPGLIGATLDSKVVAGIICDGVHVHPSSVRAAWTLLGPRLVLITDAMAAAGLGNGVYQLGNREVQVEGGVVTNSTGRLAGSTLTLDRAIRNLIEFTSCEPAQAVAAASSVPATLLGLDRPADRVRFDDAMEVVETTVDSKVVWER
jgi:N-acetylglucosamine-6-phosphate deacetylase